MSDEHCGEVELIGLDMAGEELSFNVPEGSTFRDVWRDVGYYFCFEQAPIPGEVSVAWLLSLSDVENCFQVVFSEVFPETPPNSHVVVSSDGILEMMPLDDGRIVIWDGERLATISRTAPSVPATHFCCLTDSHLSVFKPVNRFVHDGMEVPAYGAITSEMSHGVALYLLDHTHRINSVELLVRMQPDAVRVIMSVLRLGQVEALAMNGDSLTLATLHATSRMLSAAPALKRLVLKKIGATLEMTRGLGQSLSISRLQSLHFTRSGLTSETVRPVVEALPECLEELVLTGNCLGDEGAELVAGSLPRHRNLRMLALNNCSIGDVGGAALARVLPMTSLRDVRLASSKLSAGVAVDLCRFLACGVEHKLSLARCGLEDGTGEELISSLPTRMGFLCFGIPLTFELELTGNNFSDDVQARISRRFGGCVRM